MSSLNSSTHRPVRHNPVDGPLTTVQAAYHIFGEYVASAPGMRIFHAKGSIETDPDKFPNKRIRNVYNRWYLHVYKQSADTPIDYLHDDHIREFISRAFEAAGETIEETPRLLEITRKRLKANADFLLEYQNYWEAEIKKTAISYDYNALNAFIKFLKFDECKTPSIFTDFPGILKDGVLFPRARISCPVLTPHVLKSIIDGECGCGPYFCRHVQVIIVRNEKELGLVNFPSIQVRPRPSDEYYQQFFNNDLIELAPRALPIVNIVADTLWRERKSRNMTQEQVSQRCGGSPTHAAIHIIEYGAMPRPKTLLTLLRAYGRVDLYNDPEFMEAVTKLKRSEKVFGYELCRRRWSKGWSTEDLGELLSVDRNTIPRWEQELSSPNPEHSKAQHKPGTFEKLCTLLEWKQEVAQQLVNLAFEKNTKAHNDRLKAAKTNLAAYICEVRRLRNLEQQQLATAAGVGLSAIADLERGRVPKVLPQICVVLQLNYDEVIARFGLKRTSGTKTSLYSLQAAS